MNQPTVAEVSRARRSRRRLLPNTLIIAIVGLPGAAAAGTLEYNRDIRPILSENCFQCHGPDHRTRKADLRLDVRDAALAKEAIAPGKPDESELIARIESHESDEVMPPPQSTKRLSEAQKQTLKEWVRQGAVYQPHWAYVAPQRGTVPKPERGEWVRNPVDAFVLARLESKGIAPSPEADRATLLRRLSLDLIGLPPTPEEVHAFLNDKAPRAYEQQVERLLASPHFGERMAVGWLDLVRFADTVGYHGDQNQHIFPYRDYVIDAFNRNLPFDRFTLEQLAGDLLPNPTPEQLVATGFNRLNMMTREGGAQPKEYLAKYAADRVRTVSMTWLGSTMGCAECHDHKFDPFTARDFYRMEAFFADLTQWGVYADYGYTPNPDLKGWTNDHPFPPEIEVDSPYLQRRRDRLQAQAEAVLAAAVERLTTSRSGNDAFQNWLKGAADFLGDAPKGWAAPPVFEDSKENEDTGPSPQPMTGLRLTGKGKRGPEHRLVAEPKPGWIAALRVDVLPSEEPAGSVMRDGALLQLSASLLPKDESDERPLPFSEADANAKEPRYAQGSALIGVKQGWKTSPRRRSEPQSSVWLFERPVRLAEGERLAITIKSDRPVHVRISVSPLASEDPARPRVRGAILQALATAPNQRTSGQTAQLRRLFLLRTGYDVKALAEYQRLRREVLECRSGRALSMITRARESLTVRVLPRGNWLDESGAAITPGVPEFLPGPTDSAGRRLTRLDLARWLTSSENPLTARVFVNRLWRQYFGTGLSSVVDDLGAQGEWPSHPELLDWLSVEFQSGGWDVKHMVTLLVTSATYRQDARPRADLREIDPFNRLLAAQSARRLEAEFVRDNALAIAGLLDPEVGGPSAHPYQPAGYYANLQFPDRDYLADRDERQYRRGLYTHWQRTFLHPMLANFDAPSREECAATRNAANTPQQALTLLNDPTFVEAARVLAQRLMASQSTTDRDRIDLLFQRALARPAKAKEQTELTAFLEAQRRLYRADAGAARELLHVGLTTPQPEADPAELAAWTNVCRVVLNLHETITRM